MEKKGLRVNMGKTNIMVSSMNLDLLKKAGKDHCYVCHTGVGSNAIFCGGCLCWIHKNAVALRAPCALTLISGAPDARERHGLLMEEQ